ncbi:MAG: hypothetical protein ACE5OZ_15665 [Candidatus Heimdallarchaeota archaeon]
MNTEKLVLALQPLQGTSGWPGPFDPTRVFLMIIRASKRGPEVLVTENLPFKENKSELFFTRICNFYAMAIGQGEEYYEGLYGPLPLTHIYSSLVYARILPDSTQDDQRFPGKTYALICLGYPKEQDHLFGDRINLKRGFSSWVTSVDDLSKVDLASLGELRDVLMKALAS